MQNIHIIRIIYHYDQCTDCLLSLQIVQNFYTSQSLGGGGPQTPRALPP